jgi:hypothetical protein
MFSLTGLTRRFFNDSFFLRHRASQVPASTFIIYLFGGVAIVLKRICS